MEPQIKIRKVGRDEVLLVATLAKGLDEYYQKKIKIYDKWNTSTLEKYVNHVNNLFDQGHTILVAVVGDFNVGYIAGKTFVYDYDDKVHGKIAEVFVREEYRKKGIGTKLEEEMEKLFKEDGAVGVFASIYVRNNESLKFHEERGFERVEEYIDLHKEF